MDSVHIRDLPGPGIEHHIHARTDLDPRCKRDITHFIDDDTDEEVGGVTYDGLSPEFFSIIQDNHAHFSKNVQNVTRGNAFQKMDYGKMAAAGFCQPKGGAVGSGYGNPYGPSQIRSHAIIDKQIADQYVQNLFRMGIAGALSIKVVLELILV